MSNCNNSDDILAKHKDLSTKLNIEEFYINRSWNSFKEMSEMYTLDGDPLHWLACALYVECGDLNTKNLEYTKANLNLSNLLKLYNISLIQLLNKIKKWMEMASLTNDFKLKIEKLERKFVVSTLLFQKFQPIFKELFATTDPAKAIKKRNKSITVNSLFEFTWCLFICVKGEFRNTADNLVDMFHILLSCLDYIFQNVFMSRKKYLLNPDFKGFPSDYFNDDYELPSKAPCIISFLCETHDCSTLEAITSKQYCWKPVIEDFFDKKVLKGNERNYTGILDVNNYDDNVQSLTNVYESIILNSGEFDERMFLSEQASSHGGSSNVSREELTQAIGTFGAAPDTPLTGRGYLRRAEPMTPISAATDSIAKLRAFLSGSAPQPSQQLLTLFSSDGISSETVEQLVVSPCREWAERFSSALASSAAGAADRSTLVTTLHYKVLEQILKTEKQKKPHVPIMRLVEQNVFLRTVFACCAEVVVHVYGAHALRFPRLLQVLDLSAFHFYRIIELVVLVLMERLSRDVIKHLNAVEEQALESLVWSADSPLWARLEGGERVPASCNVYGPRPEEVQSPVSTAADRFLTPAVDHAKKQLFQDNIKPGQSLLVKDQVTPTVAVTNNQTPQKNDGSTTPKKNGSLVLFFRKFYSLAVVRMNDLCSRLRLTDQELRTKIWTCLEHSLVHQTHLLRDRHLDQILMCAVYVICKVSNNPNNAVERTFTEIMRCYRQQPQADNHVYRSVLIGVENPQERGDLIQFYNKVYVQCMQSFALRFTGKHKDECSLSPIPAGRGAGAARGRRVSERHRLYVHPLTSSPPTHRHLSYHISRSPAKDLQAINTMLSSEASVLKRVNECANSSVLVKRPCAQPAAVSKKLHGLISDRQAV